MLALQAYRLALLRVWVLCHMASPCGLAIPKVSVLAVSSSLAKSMGAMWRSEGASSSLIADVGVMLL